MSVEYGVGLTSDVAESSALRNDTRRQLSGFDANKRVCHTKPTDAYGEHGANASQECGNDDV